MIIEIHAREICQQCKGTGHETKADGRRGLSCLKCGGHKWIERWIPLDDLKLSQDLTAAIRNALADHSRPI